MNRVCGHPTVLPHPVNGKCKPIAMHLLIGNQAIPGFFPGTRQARDNGDILNGWTIVVQEVSAW